MEEYEVHEVANIFPSMDRAEFDELVRDIEEHGLREPIWLHEDKIIDGRHRYMACKACGRQPCFRVWDGEGSLVRFIYSLNRHRRHLTESQKAAVAVEMLPHLEAEARLRQATSGPGLYGGEPLRPDLDRGVRGRATEQAARAMGAGRQNVSDLKRIKTTAPAVFDAVHAGQLNTNEARQLERVEEPLRDAVLQRVSEGGDATKAIRDVTQRARAAEAVRELASPAALGRFAVLFADPPWQYEYAPSRSRDVENQYPTLPLDEICTLPVEENAYDDSVLFLWATSPKLEEALQVMHAWGFDYVTSMVWVKDELGMGYYARQCHELLLIGKRGELPTPLPEHRPRSVIQAHRGQHSAKPTEVYEVIERMYPDLPRLELFARTARAGWQSWGYEAPANEATA